MSESLQLYRKLLKAVNGIPVRPIQRKLSYNIRQLFDLYRLPQPGTELIQLHRDAEAAVQVLKWFRNLPQVWCDWSFCTVLVVHTDPTNPHCVTRQQNMTCFESTRQLMSQLLQCTILLSVCISCYQGVHAGRLRATVLHVPEAAVAHRVKWH